MASFPVTIAEVDVLQWNGKTSMICLLASYGSNENMERVSLDWIKQQLNGQRKRFCHGNTYSYFNVFIYCPG